MRPQPKERALAYIRSPKTPDAVAGQSGDRTTFAVACTLAVDFGLDDGDVRELLGLYNSAKCRPVWGERDIERFVRSARRTANSKPGEVGKLLGVDRENYSGPSSPANKPAAQPETKPAQTSPAGGVRSEIDTRRTARTPFFKVLPAGEGAEPRTARTVRTLPVYSFPISSSSISPRLEESKKEVSEKSEPAKPVAVPSAAPRPAVAARPAPVERTDLTTIMRDGDVWRKPWGRPEHYVGNLKDGRNYGLNKA